MDNYAPYRRYTNKNEDVSLMESTGGVDGNDKYVNFFMLHKKLFVKSLRTNKLSPHKLSPKSSLETGE